MKKRPTGWDTETHLIKPGLTAPRLVCLSAVDESGVKHLYSREEGLDFFEERILPNPNVAHHTFFDLGVIAAERPRLLPDITRMISRGDAYCTKIRQMMIDNARGELKYIWDETKGEMVNGEWKGGKFVKQTYQLWRLIQRHKGYDVQTKKEGGGDIWRLRYSELDGVPVSEYPAAASEYAISDSVEAQDIWDCQETDLGGDDIPGFVSEMEAAWALNLLGTWGLRTDPVMIPKVKAAFEEDYARQVAICRKYGLRRGNAKDWRKILDEEIRAGVKKETRSRDMKAIKAAVEKWYKEAGRKPKLTPKGDIGTDREQLTTTKHKGLNAVAESVRIEKLLSTYIPALERGSVVPLNPNYNPIIETFRTSCSGGQKIHGIPVGMNVQNLPRSGSIRDCVIPREGWVFGFCDYDTLEYRSLAQVCIDWFGFSDIADEIKAGRDPHVAFAANMFETTYDELFADYKAGDKKAGEGRQFCKIAGYGCMGGMGPDTLVDYARGAGITISPDLARDLHRGFRRKFTEMNPYFDACSEICGEGDAEYVVFPQSGQVRGRVRYTAVCNGFFQHLAAKGAKAALVQTVWECYCDAGSPLYGCRPWLFCHDEIGIEIPYRAFGPKRAHEALVRLEEVMEWKMSEWIPDVPIGASSAMAFRWYKGAKAIRAKGIIMPVRAEIYTSGGKKRKKWVIDDSVR